MDGFIGYYCLYRAKLFAKDARVYPDVPSSRKIPEGTIGKHVVIVDVAYNVEVIKGILEIANSVLYIDHHVSNIEDIKKINSKKLSIFYNDRMSGASLTWRFCFKSPIPKFILYVEDHDIGAWKLKHTKAFILALKMNFDFTNYKSSNLRKFDKLFDIKYINNLIYDGNYYLKYREKLIKDSENNYSMRKMKFNDEIYNVAVINSASPLTGDLATQISKHNNVDFAFAWTYDHNKNIYFVTLRSQHADVSQIAKHFGGGGHKYASAFATNKFIEEFFMTSGK